MEQLNPSLIQIKHGPNAPTGKLQLAELGFDIKNNKLYIGNQNNDIFLINPDITKKTQEELNKRLSFTQEVFEGVNNSAISVPILFKNTTTITGDFKAQGTNQIQGKIFLKENINYGYSLPQSPSIGQLFFKLLPKEN